MRSNSLSHPASLLSILLAAILAFAGGGGLQGQSDVSILGSVQVTIEPPEAAAAGARWSLDGLPAQPSGAVLAGLAPGHHLLELTPLAGLIEPEEAEILVVGGAVRTISLSYSPLPSFYFKSIPPQIVRPDSPLRFVVLSSDPGDPSSPPPGAALAVTADPPPVGPLTFDPASGDLRYAVDAQDRRDFTLTFRPSTGGASGSVVISPSPTLPPEEDVLQFDRPLPDPLSKDYIQIREAVSTAPGSFNFVDGVHTRAVSISGRHLLFKAGSVESDLHERYHEDKDIQELKLYADKVTIQSPLHLPQTRVEIHARELRFEGNGSLDVTPAEHPIRKPTGITIADPDRRGHDGIPGLAASPMTLFIESFHSDAGLDRRIIIRGGVAQDAGEGRDGQNILDPSHVTCGFFQGRPIIYTKCTLRDGEVLGECGQKTVHAENAVPAGRPGLGGAGGTLTSTLDLSPFVDSSGGLSGAIGLDRSGGTGAGPFATETFTTLNKPGAEPCAVVHHSTVFADPGAPGFAPAAEAAAGAAGGFVLEPTPGAWLHPIIVRSTLLFVADAYLNERIPEARAILDDYGNFIAALKSDLPDGEEKAEFEQIAQTIESLLNRIDSNLDYFGNPVTWVPLLSFEANLAAFTNEVERGIPVLYLAHWVQYAANQAMKTKDASIAAKGRLNEENDEMVVAYAEAQQELPGLVAESQAVQQKVLETQAKLVALQAELEKRAKDNVEERHKLPFWKKALGVLGAVSTAIPLGQPYLGFAGAGLSLLTKFDPDRPLASLEGGAALFKTVIDLDYTACIKKKADETKKDPKQEDKFTLKERLKACSPLLSAAYKGIRSALKETKADQSEIAAELEKIRASDPVFQKTTKDLEVLNAQKQLLGERLAAVLDKLSKFTSSVNENELAIDKIDRDLSAALDVLDHPTLLYVADMARRTKDRLLYFQYLMAKAFQYRTLKPYSGNLRLDSLLERVLALVESQNSTPLLTPDQFNSLKAIYLEELSSIAAGIINDLNVNVPARSGPVSFRLTADEIAALNEQGSVELDLARKGLFGVNEEDLRIVSLSTQELDVEVHGTIGTTATLRLTFAHSGFSRISKGGRPFIFTHYRTERVNPITWSTVYDGLSDTYTETEISAATESLLRSLLGPSADPDILLYSRPSARATLVLSKEVTADNGVDLEVKGLTLKLQYDFSQANPSLRGLDVETSDGLMPRILFDRDDLFGRQDGRGLFRRTFSGPGTVRLEAPSTHGRFTFDHWEVDGVAAGGGAEPSRTIDVSLNKNRAVRAVYRDGGPTGETLRRGDVDGSGTMDITDAVTVLGFLFQGGQSPACPDAADADDSGVIDITDSIAILGYLFLGGAEPPSPGPTACGADPTADELGACASSICQ